MFRDEINLEIKCASVPELLTKLADSGIAIRSIACIDLLHINCCVQRKDYRRVLQILNKCGAEAKILKHTGVFQKINQIRKRPVLLWGVFLLLVLVILLPTRVLFVCVNGNEQISTSWILEKAAEKGVYFGASRQHIRSERIKNALLADIPELQWIGINTKGCVAVISVEERSKQLENPLFPSQTGIVSAKDGIITDISVTRGTTLCKVGQAVKKGQLLVSGIADYGICVKETGADGEIYAQTGNVLRVLSPRKAMKRVSKNDTCKRYGIILGKKLINFYKDSGISGANCDRMYKQSYMVLPGGMQLPVSFVVEEINSYKTEQYSLPDDKMDWINAAAEDYLIGHTVAGEILKKSVSVKLQDAYCELYGTYQCREIISRHQNKGE